MALGAFYGSLAASASVFIAILSAFLVNNLVSIRQDRRRLQRRQVQITSDLKPLESLRNTYAEKVQSIEEKWDEDKRKSIDQNVGVLIRRHYNMFNYLPIPEYLTFSQIVEDYADFEYDGATDQVSELERDILRKRQGDIMEEVTDNIAYTFVDHHTDGTSGNISASEIIELYKEEYDLDTIRKQTEEKLSQKYKEHATMAGVLRRAKEDTGPLTDMDSSAVFPEAAAAGKSQQLTREESRHTMNEIEKAKVSAEINGLQNQRENVTERLESLSLAHIRRTLRDCAIAIILTVILPLSVYLSYEIEFYPIDGPAWISPVTVFVLWLCGFGLVLFRLWRGLSEGEDFEYDSLPEELIGEAQNLLSRN